MFIEALLEAVFEAVFTIVIEAFKAPWRHDFPDTPQGSGRADDIAVDAGRCHRIPFGTVTSMALEESNITMHRTPLRGPLI